MSAAVDDAPVLRTLEAREPGFLPAPLAGAGAALVAALAHDVALVEAALAAAPDKYFLAFLDAMGLTLLSPRPARAPLVFRLAPDAPVDLSLPRGSEVAAVLAPALPGSLAAPAADPPATEPIVFATDQDITLTRAKLAAVLSIVPAEDREADHSAALASGFSLFADPPGIAHHLYLGDDRLFDLSGNATVTVRASVASGPQPAAVSLRWEYATADGWLEFDPVRDRTHGLVYDGEIVLEKRCAAKTAKRSIAGRETYWIRARTDRKLPLRGTTGADAPLLPRLETLRARVALGEDGLPLDAAYADGIAVDASRDFRPFGPLSTLGSTFAIACDAAFKRDGAEITLELTRSAGATPTPRDPQLVWEYSTGPGTWARIVPMAGELLDQDVVLARQDNWAAAPYNGEQHYWLRVRIAGGDYGPPVTYAIGTGGTVTASGGAHPPSFARLTVGYRIETAAQPLGACLTLNRFDTADVTLACRFGRPGFQPFAQVEDLAPAVYIGFDAPLPLGLVSLFVEVPATTEAVDPPQSPFAWEYRSADGWLELAVLDDTDGFRRRGLVQLVGPPDLAPAAGPTGAVYWVRARLKTTAGLLEPLPVAAIHLNGVWATHRQVVRGEVVGRSDGSPRLTLVMHHSPVLEDETVEVQEWSGRGREWQGLFAGVDPDAMRIDRDPRGEPIAVWVRWTERPHLYSSRPDDRHYMLERTAGLLRFGDGLAGMIPPPGSVVSASYVWGGGTGGNMPAATISQLRSAVPYVDTVSNPVPASGGSEPEAIDAVRARGPHRLRNRDRALSAADYEWLAREASAEVAWARCVPATGPEAIFRPGWVTVAIAPWSDAARPEPSPELLRVVHGALTARAPAAIARSIRVVGPTYQPISVVSEVVVSEAGSAAKVEELLRSRLDGFLHPLTGGPQGRGWELGGAIHLSSVARIVERTPGVDHATELQLTVEGAVYGDRIPLEPGRLPAAGRHVIKLRPGT